MIWSPESREVALPVCEGVTAEAARLATLWSFRRVHSEVAATRHNVHDSQSLRPAPREQAPSEIARSYRSHLKKFGPVR